MFSELAVAHLLILTISQGLSWRHRDRVAGVHSDWIDIVDRTNDNHVVVLVADDLKLEFFPSVQRLLNDNLADARRLQSAGGNVSNCS